MGLTVENLSDYRAYLRANMFDGDEGGKVTMGIRDLLDEIIELTTDFLDDGEDD